MTLAPDENELRVRAALRARIDGVPPPVPPSHPPVRPRDWLDDLMDEAPAPAAPPPPPPAGRPGTAPVPDGPSEPRWDWRRLTHWPYARLTLGACAVLIPLHQGEPAAGTWAHILRQARTQAGVLPAWIIAAVGISTAAVLVHRRRSWWAYGLLVTTFIGTVAMASPYDIVTFTTGVTR